jgi:hypothetical protein
LNRAEDMPDSSVVISVGSRRRPLAVRRLMNLFVLVVVLGLLLFVWLQVVRTLTGTVKPQAAVGKPTALAWGGRVFSSQAKLEAWLRERGVSYSVWAKRHRAAVGIVRPSVTAPARRRAATKRAAVSSHVAKNAVPTHRSAPKRVAAASSSRAAKKVAAAHRPAPKRVVAAAAVSSASGDGSSGLMSGLLWGVTLLLAAVAVAPSRLVARVPVYRLRPEQRTILGAAAAAFAVGLLLASSAP